MLADIYLLCAMCVSLTLDMLELHAEKANTV